MIMIMMNIFIIQIWTSSPRGFDLQMCQTPQTHAKFAKLLSDYKDVVNKRDEMIFKATRFHHDIVLEIAKYCHLNEEPTTQRSFDSYQTRRADVVKPPLRNHSLIYPMVMKVVRKADPWSCSGPFDH